MAEPKNRVLDRRAYIIGSTSETAADVDSTNKALNTMAKLQAYDGSTWQNLLTQSSTYYNLRTCIANGNNIVNVISGNYDGRAATNYGLVTISNMHTFNGVSWDRLRTYYDTGNVSFTSTGVGGQNDLKTGMSKHTWHVITNASASNVTVKLQGSIDSNYWFDLDEWSGIGTTMRHVVNKPIRYIRFNVTSMGDATSITCRYWGMI